MMNLKDAWQRWSFKAAVVAAALNVALIFLPFLEVIVSPVAYAVLNAAMMTAIAILRVWPQESLSD
jgi:hypothetical protein